MDSPPIRPIVWMGDSLATLRAFPRGAREEIGFALYQAQTGHKQVSAKPMKGRAKMSTRSDHIVGSGNVFADLGVPKAEEQLAKAELAQKIVAILDQRRITQAQAAEILGVDQPKISALKHGRLSGVSLGRLVRFLILLGSDVQIVVKARSRARGQARLLVA